MASKKPDGAARIAEKYLPKAGGYIGEAIDHLDEECARDIRRLVAREVRKARAESKVVRWSHDDELVATGLVHIERMSDQHIWIGVGDRGFGISTDRAVVHFWDDMTGAPKTRRKKGTP